jgi:hypothetical protein
VPVLDPGLAADPVDLEEMVLAYMGQAARPAIPAAEARR